MVTPMANKLLQTGKIKVPWVIVLVTVVVILLFARLGFWQLSRAQEKIDMLDDAAQAAELPALTQLSDAGDIEVYRSVSLRGRFDFERQFLRDNSVYNQQPGYEVLTPFRIESPDGAAPVRTILVNRGWVPLGPNRQQLPDITENTNNAEPPLTGLLVKPSRGFTLGEALYEAQQQWPLVLQFLDYETIAQRLDTMALLPAVVVLAAEHPYSYTYAWKPVADGPEKHYGYAFQWFAMLVAVLVLFFYLNFYKKDEPDTV